ncbi:MULTISPECIES: peptide MFS transporter [unclassified Tenacibaculum]|uniref:peptide MFS transporter n=1 Tax=unclassified Tenacibaculum TaxID=2635139 RepID=UPI001F215E8C|nr:MULTISPECIES: peptide MFS transporter [unclassified Tenacibaculum]MCF2875288.1 peptide MFS transporter [Tenacibaculum sp. Cn5-1]MCF2935364.1 peptide MFS transporter [Tenacibaculum sp. Cn5-34]MCG7511924.1 peptide MFS transporter [Tenacibaculum sp. Cn5-46]
MAQLSNKQPHEKEVFGHPIGLYVLFFTELWERFSYYGMRALLVLFLTAAVTSDNPGWGWTESEAISLYKWYTTLVYLAAIPGGIIADKLLGQKKTVMLGGLLLCIGHGVLAIDAPWAFYTGLGFIIAGVGGLKPNISTMVGGLYGKGDDRRDKGFTIFYIGINIGAFLAGIIIGQLGENVNWHYGFGLAGIGMFIGQIIYMWGQKYLKGTGNFIGAKEATLEEKEAMNRPLTNIEKDRIKVMLLSFLIVIVFWGAFEQAGGLMNLYAKSKTDRMLFGWEVPASYFQSVNAFFIFTLGILVANFWIKWGRKGKESSSLFKMATGVIIMGLGFVFMSFASSQYETTGTSGMYWLVLAYLFHTVGELCTSPVSLSFITKLAPVKYASLMMGAYFAATGLGNFVAGTIGEQIKNFSELQLFTGITIFCVIFGLLIIALLKPLKRLTHGAEDINGSKHEEAEGFELADNN